MNNDNVVYLKEGGVLEDDNIMWVIYSLTDHNKKPNIPQSDKMKIGLFHGPIQGATTDMGFAFDDGYDTNQFSGCDIVLAGDIHKRQTLWLNQEIEVSEEDVEKYLKKGWEIV